MTTKDIITILPLVFSLIAIGISILSLFESRKANGNTLHGTKIFFDAHISSARNKVINIDLKLVPLLAKDKILLSAEDKNRVRLYQKSRLEAQESYLNSLNQACNAYLANKLDKKVFLIEYKDDITLIYKEEPYKTMLIGKNDVYSGIIDFIKKEQIVSV